MADTLYNGRRFRTLNVLNEGVREVLGIEIDTSLPAKRVVRVLNQLKEWYGVPEAIRCDNGPELISSKFASWCEENKDWTWMWKSLRTREPANIIASGLLEMFQKAPTAPTPSC